MWRSFLAASWRVEVTTQCPGRKASSELVVDVVNVAGCTRSPPRSRITKPVGIRVEQEGRGSVFCECASKVTPLRSRGGVTAVARRRECLFCFMF